MEQRFELIAWFTTETLHSAGTRGNGGLKGRYRRIQEIMAGSHVCVRREMYVMLGEVDWRYIHVL